MDDSQTMTPMIDVVFLLLVFFICASANQVIEYTLPTELNAGSVEVAQAEPQESWVTEIRLGVTQPEQRAEARIEMNGRSFTSYDQFRQTLLALANVSRDSPVILDVAENVSLGELIKIYDTCRGAEFDSIHFAMKKSELKKRL